MTGASTCQRPAEPPGHRPHTTPRSPIGRSSPAARLARRPGRSGRCAGSGRSGRGCLAIAVSELFAGLVAGAPSLVVAVRVARHQPPAAGRQGGLRRPLRHERQAGFNALVVIAAVAIAAIAGVPGRARPWARLGGSSSPSGWSRSRAVSDPAAGPTSAGRGQRDPRGDDRRRRAGGPASGLGAAGTAGRACDHFAARRDARLGLGADFLIAGAGTLAGAVGCRCRRASARRRPAPERGRQHLAPARGAAERPADAADQTLSVPGMTPLVVPQRRFLPDRHGPARCPRSTCRTWTARPEPGWSIDRSPSPTTQLLAPAAVRAVRAIAA